MVDGKQVKALDPQTFGKLPVHSLQHITPETWADVEADAIAQLGHRKYSQIGHDNILLVQRHKLVTMFDAAGHSGLTTILPSTVL